jgi:L-lactate dehydrogenase (cytochrome)
MKRREDEGVMSRPEQCHNLADFEAVARRRLPSPLYHYIVGGADDEGTTRANTSAFDRYELIPRFLRDISRIDMRRTVLGRELAWPLILAPTGMSRLFHPDGEMAVAREASSAGIGYALSTMATTSVEKIGALPGPKIFQLYMLNDDALNFEIIDRARTAGFDALCVTVDTVWAGNRERDLRTGLTVPPSFTASSLLAFATHPGWCLGYLKGESFTLPNVPGAKAGDVSTLAAYFAQRMERHISWERIERIASHWDGPFAVKGLQAVEDARIAATMGCTAVIVSNHGGRQLDGGAATIDLIADMADAIGDRLELILDGGARRGAHVAKALAMGARAVMTGRPYLYGLSAFGAPGVARVIELLRSETERTLGLLGCARLDDLGRDHIRLAGAAPTFLRDVKAPEQQASTRKNWPSPAQL